MSDSDAKTAELLELLSRLCDGGLDQAGWDKLDSLLLDDPAAQQLYRRFMALDVNLAWRAADRSPLAQFEPPVSVPFPIAAIVPHSSFGAPHSSVGSFLLSYGAAALIVGVGMVIGWLCHVGDQRQLAGETPHPGRTPTRDVQEAPFVGHVTSMADCVWADPKTATVSHARVPLGRKFALAAGLMEIAYDTGAGIILQGPCVYEVRSDNGGYLSAGRLTARVEKRGEGRGERGEGRKLAASVTGVSVPSPPSSLPSPLSPLLPPLFFVRTPTATVTDLGTEFGVEVSKAGVTETQVFVGKVKIEGKGALGNVLERTLHAGQAARLDPHRGLVTVAVSKDAERRFVRKMPTFRPSPLELIGKLDYSDTWSANSPTRTGSYLMLTTPESLQVEHCHGNPPRSWVFSRVSAMTTWPYDDSPVKWPGFQVQGARSGFTETGMEGTCYFGFEYGLRDDFVVQFDAVQSEDRINVTIGDKPATIDSGQSLSVFIRPAGTKHPEIGVYTPSKGEADAGIRSGITTALQWHNYAVRFNLGEKRLTVWVDGKRRGSIDLARVTQGMAPGTSWASLPWTAKCVTIGGYSQKDKGRLWTDNFRVGSPKPDTPESRESD